MDEYNVPDGDDLATTHSSAAVSTSGAGNAVPWLEGALFRYLAGDAVLDIKAADDPDGSPVTPCATVSTQTRIQVDAGGPYDAVFSRNALGLVDDPRATLALWFGMLRTGGHLVIVLPHETVTHSAFGALRPSSAAMLAPPAPEQKCRAATTESILKLVDSALPAGNFEIVHLDTAPARRAADWLAAMTELRLVLRKVPQFVLQQRGFALPGAADPKPAAEAVIPFVLTPPAPVIAPGMRAEGTLLIRDFAPSPANIARILVLKLDHHGDFIIGLPALRELREAFPQAYIRLICGRWNIATARASGIVDDVRGFDFFTERAADWTGVPMAPDWTLFNAAAEGVFDLAVDLRVDDDTRAMLARIDAKIRCGIGSQSRFPLLDIALPDVSRDVVAPACVPPQGHAAGVDGAQLFGVDSFVSDMQVRHETHHETAFIGGDHCVLRSETVFLPTGRYSAEFDLSTRGFVPALDGVGVGIEVIANDEHKIADKWIGRRQLRRLSARQAALVFNTAGDGNYCQFRVHMSGRPLTGRLRFGGLRLRVLNARGARFRPSELHIGEKLSLLVNLIRQRTLALGAGRDSGTDDAARQDGRLSFVVAPFSNSTVRDWPVEQYARLIEMLTECYDCEVTIVGAPGQAAQARNLMTMMRGHAGYAKVNDRVGATQWSDLGDILRAADLVICNNSGIAHQAADLGSRTLALYSASHQPLEWGPRGARSRAIMMSVTCSPCGYERLEHCRSDHLCMRLMTPEIVIAQVAELLAGSA